MNPQDIYCQDTDHDTLNEFYSGKTVLVTGGVGSIGREIVRQLLSYGTHTVRVLDNNETELFNIEKDLDDKRLRMLVGDVRDKERMVFAMEGVDIVFHSAALKHVPLCEYNPFEAIHTNVIGTQNVIEAAIQQHVKKLIFVSTDKSVSPANVMGATKLLAERLVRASNRFMPADRIVFSAVRFGNVVNSRGSIVPLFRSQIKKGFVTVTDPDMTRFVMTIKKAVTLVLASGYLSTNGEIFIFKMPAVRIGDLAEAIVAVESEKLGVDPGSIEIRVVGTREGEKADEDLMTELEALKAMECGDMMVLTSDMQVGIDDETLYMSDKAKKLSVEEIKALIGDATKG